MTAFLAFLRKEALEIRRTWRMWVLPGMLLLFGVVDPVLAKITPDLLESVASDQPGTVIVLPEPVAHDALVQFAKSLSQVVLIALIIATADLIAGERRSGTAVLVLTKPLRRGAFVLAKASAQAALTLAATLLGTLVCAVATRLIFGGAPVGDLLAAVTIWLAFAGLVIAAMTLASTLLRAQAGAAGVGIGGYAGLALLGQWRPAARWTPAGLFAAVTDAANGRETTWAWPVVSAVALAAVCLLLAIRAFGRQELAQASAG